MSGEAWLYLLAVLINAVNLFLQVFFTIMYSDLEWYVCTSFSLWGSSFCIHRFSCGVKFRGGGWTGRPSVHSRLRHHELIRFFFPYCSDYINPIDLCNRLNAYIIPEAAVHAFLTFLFVINGYWLAIALNLPLLAFNAKKCVFRSRELSGPRASQLTIVRSSRIYENQHLLDATEIFRKLNVHKKVRHLHLRHPPRRRSVH